MTNPVVHFEIIGKNTVELQAYYKQLFGWVADTSAQTAPEVSSPGEYGFINGEDNTIPGGIGGGKDFTPRVIVYVGVPDVEEALKKAEVLGGARIFGPVAKPGAEIVVGQFTDPEGNTVGVAGPK